jgi:tryptophan synthase alpha chain
LSASLALVSQVRARVSAPIVIFTYANPLMRMGIETFARRAASSGVDGVLALDLPIEEAQGFHDTLEAAGLDTIFLLSPTTTDVRIRRAAELGSGFLYGISRLGVTGARDRVASGAEAMVKRIRQVTTMPIALGFGISRPEHVAEVGLYADAAVVGPTARSSGRVPREQLLARHMHKETELLDFICNTIIKKAQGM